MVTFFKKYLFVIIFLALLAIPAVSFAADPPWQLVPTCGDGGCNVCDAIGVGINITKIMLGTLGSAALLIFVYGGFLMLYSRGHSDQVQKGKDALINAVKGVIIVLASWMVINYGLAIMLGQEEDLSKVTIFDSSWSKVACKSQPSSSCKKVGEPCGAGYNCDGDMECVETCVKHFGNAYSCKLGGADCQTGWCPGQADNIQCCK
ncbi:MAG TPA: pilin [Patescibacteria group bacterium]|nr:pilin [Patescibacteria group bacterium]